MGWAEQKRPNGVDAVHKSSGPEPQACSKMSRVDEQKEMVYKANIFMLKQQNKLLEARLALNEKEQAAYVQARYFLYEQRIKERDEEIEFLKSCSRIPEKDVLKCIQEAPEKDMLKCLQEAPPDKSDSDSSSSTSSMEETQAEFKNRVIHEMAEFKNMMIHEMTIFKNMTVCDINAKYDQSWLAFKAMVEAKLSPSLNSPLLPKQ
jgi:hypothetical protein